LRAVGVFDGDFTQIALLDTSLGALGDDPVKVFGDQQTNQIEALSEPLPPP
jgi:hypothetical protein